MDKTLYTINVYSENIAGILNQITTIFTRRQLNIESLNVSASSIKGVHKYTITCYCDKDTIEKIVKQMERRIDVLQAQFFTDDEIFFQEIALYKVSTEELLASNRIEEIVHQHNAHIIEINKVYTVIEKSGPTKETQMLYEKLKKWGILQFVRSGRIAITKSCVERLSEYLNEREDKHRQSKLEKE